MVKKNFTWRAFGLLGQVVLETVDSKVVSETIKAKPVRSDGRVSGELRI